MIFVTYRECHLSLKLNLGLSQLQIFFLVHGHPLKTNTLNVLGGEQNRKQEFVFRFRQCRYRTSGRKKNKKFVSLLIDFREDIFPVYFYSESESNSLKSIQRITNSPAFFLPDIPIPALLEPESKFLVPVPLTPQYDYILVVKIETIILFAKAKTKLWKQLSWCSASIEHLRTINQHKWVQQEKIKSISLKVLNSSNLAEYLHQENTCVPI